MKQIIVSVLMALTGSIALADSGALDLDCKSPGAAGKIAEFRQKPASGAELKASVIITGTRVHNGFGIQAEIKKMVYWNNPRTPLAWEDVLKNSVDQDKSLVLPEDGTKPGFLPDSSIVFRFVPGHMTKIALVELWMEGDITKQKATDKPATYNSRLLITYMNNTVVTADTVCSVTGQ